jgi:arsenate reductase
MKTVLFACVHSAGRSQMAAALFNHAVRRGAAVAIAAGTRPADHVHPEVVDAMREVGLDLSAAAPRLLTDELARRADMLITMGCKEHCPWVPGQDRIDWGLDDPKGRPPEEVRRIRDDIRARVEQLLADEGWS